MPVLTIAHRGHSVTIVPGGSRRDRTYQARCGTCDYRSVYVTSKPRAQQIAADHESREAEQNVTVR